MAMFDTKEKEEQGGMKINEGENETIIGASVKVEGDFTSDGNVLVQGVVSGSLKTKGNLQVDEGAKIKADVDAANAVVRGEIKGNVSVDDNLELGEAASVEGDIVTKVLSIEPGATLNGHCLVSTSKEEIEPSSVQKPSSDEEEV